MIEQAIKSYYGERCPDHDADCVVCQAWEQWDKIRRPYRAAPAWKDSWEMPRPRTLDISNDAFNAMAQKDGGIDDTDR